MNIGLQRGLLPLVLFMCILPESAAAEVPTAPLPRPRLTDALRAKVASEHFGSAEGSALKMEKVIVREKRVPSGPPKEEQREGPFSITQGGYVLKNRGERFFTELGLWRHIDIIEDPRDQLRQSDRIRMGF